MHQRGVLNNGEELDYAFGLHIGKYRGLKSVQHGGGIAGYRSHVLWFPDERFGIAVLSNLGAFNPGKLAAQVADVYLAGKFPQEEPEAERTEVEVDPAVYDAYVGKYQLEGGALGGALMDITKEDNRLMGNLTGHPKSELFPESETRFSLELKVADMQIPLQLSFQRNETGEVTQMILYLRGQDMPGKRIECVSPTPEELAEFAGDYYSDELGTIYTMTVQDGNLVAQHRRHDDIPLTPTVADEFSGKPLWFLWVRFSRDENHRITGFILTSWRVRNLRFDKWTH